MNKLSITHHAHTPFSKIKLF